jgi:hypothetical protein
MHFPALISTAAPFNPELIIEIISADLTRRGLQAPGQPASASARRSGVHAASVEA